MARGDHNASRWTGVACAAQEAIAGRLNGTRTDAMPKGLLAATLRFVDTALDGAGVQVGDPWDARGDPLRCFNVAIDILREIRFHSMSPQATVDDLLIIRDTVARMSHGNMPLRQDEGEMAREFFERLLKMGEQERYVQYVRGSDDDDD